jgi:diguanylate cyclase (GGDEF)-like protein
MAEILDARLRELELLTQLDRGDNRLASERLHQDHVFKSMVLHLLHEGCINGLECLPWIVGRAVEPVGMAGSMTNLQAQHDRRLWGDIASALSDQEVFARLSHKGRLRRSELEQALRTGRDREPFGVLWAERHRDQAVIMAILTAQEATPISLAYLDMNGLKSINDENDHAAGDAAIKTYLQTIAMVMGDQAEGFRSGGGDEVLVVMRNTSAEVARLAMRALLMQLGKESIRLNGKEIAPYLTAACGIASTTNPATDGASLIQRADGQQKRAKLESKAAQAPVGVPRPSFLAVEHRDPEKVTLDS